MTVTALAIGIAVDAWRYRQFMLRPTEQTVQRVGLYVSVIVAVIFGMLVAKRPETFGFLMEYSYLNYRVNLKLTGERLFATSILFAEVASFMFAFLFSFVQMVAHERGNFRNTKAVVQAPRLLALFLMWFCLLFGALTFQLKEPDAKQIGQFLFILLPAYICLPTMLKHFLGTYRTLQLKRSSVSQAPAV
jgi:hypothetical protein